LARPLRAAPTGPRIPIRCLSGASRRPTSGCSGWPAPRAGSRVRPPLIRGPVGSPPTGMPEGHDVDELYFVGVVVDPEDGIAINDQWRICFRSRTGMSTTSKPVSTTETRCKMSIANTGRMLRRPTHPGELLREEFLVPMGLAVPPRQGNRGVGPADWRHRRRQACRDCSH
jgi:hypothetical protein